MATNDQIITSFNATIAAIAEDINGKQALDADLTALANASASDSLYYRVSPGVWAPVTLGSGLSFSGGVLSATAIVAAWILSTGFWNDSGVWNDAASWID